MCVVCSCCIFRDIVNVSVVVGKFKAQIISILKSETSFRYSKHLNLYIFLSPHLIVFSNIHIVGALFGDTIGILAIHKGHRTGPGST